MLKMKELIFRICLCLISVTLSGVDTEQSPKEIVLFKPGSKKASIKVPISEANSFDEQESKEFIQSFVRPGALVFDVGANVGNKTKLYLSCGARVVSFEPQPKCAQRLKKRFKKNPKVTVEAVGLGSQEAFKELYICSEAPTLSTLSKNYTENSRFSEHGFRWDETITIHLVTLDQMINKHGLPQFCKIDVENFELEVLKGMSQAIPCISFECNTDQLETTKMCLDYLTTLGYDEFNLTFGERGLFVSPDWIGAVKLLEKIESVKTSHDFSSIWGLWGDVYARKSKP